MKLKNILSNAFDAIISSYEGKRFWPSLILRLVMALASAVITAVFANTLFSKNNIVNQIFAALFFYFLMVSISKLITEIKRGGFGKRLKCNRLQYGALKTAGTVVLYCRGCYSIVSAVCLCAVFGAAAVLLGGIGE